MPLSKKFFGAIFDVKPVDDSGSLDFEMMDTVEHVVNLSSYKPRKLPVSADTSNQNIPVHKKPEEYKIPEIPKHQIESEFEGLINEIDLEVELATMTGSIPPPPRFKPALRRIQKKLEMERPPVSAEEDPRLDAILAEIQRSANARDYFYVAPPVATDVSIISEFPEIPEVFEAPKIVQSFLVTSTKTKNKFSNYSKYISWKHLVLVGGIIATGLVLIHYALNLKRQVVAESTSAVSSLQNAHDSLKTLNFANASQDFIDAYQNFTQASNQLNFMGAAITSIVGDLPGGSSVKSASNLIQAGQLLANAGSAMTQAMGAVSKTGAILNPTNPGIPVGDIMGALETALSISKADLMKASALFATVDESIIPPDKKADFDSFVSQLPTFSDAVNQGADYARFFENLISSNGTKRYLILFENSSELRPTGGFPGTYAVVTFTNGQLQDFFVDDVYNLDGQLKENIVPPLQLQHITPTWGMRDSAWYIDFPTSARNIENFYKKESNDQSIDGVITVNPKIIADILKITGPIEMPQYNLTLTSDNVLTTIQDQVEYGTNRVQPKQIVKDFAPLLLAKIYSAKSDQWLAIFNSIVSSMNQHDILMFFNDLNLETFANDHSLSGQVKNVTGDYIMPTITNVKGSKTDAVTDTSFALDTSFENNDAVHTLTITRTHNGGNEVYGFYNKQNPAYVRVLVPDGAELISVDGNDNPNFGTLVDYSKGFIRDDELTSFETSGHADDSTGVTTYRESGKTEFGFWLITNPGQTKTVTVKYRVPNARDDSSYQLYVQKQAGLVVKNFKFSMQGSDTIVPVASAPLLTQQGSEYDYSAPLDNDLAVKVNFK